jgi:hypothetical protein
VSGVGRIGAHQWRSLSLERRMTTRICILLFTIGMTAFAGCRADVTGPDARLILRDTEDGECVDTVYQDSTRRSGRGQTLQSTTQSDASEGCHVVTIWY